MENYKKYLSSNHWSKKKEETKLRFDGRCYVCNNGGKNHTHHLAYQYNGLSVFGHEKQKLLVLLCPWGYVA